MAPLTCTTEVDRPSADTFAYVTDPTRFAEWQRNVASGHMHGDGPHGVSARCVTTRRIGFATQPITSEIPHVDAPRTWGVRGIDGPIRATVNVTIDPLDDGHRSRITIAIDFHGHGIGRLLVPLVRRDAAKEMPDNMSRLEHRLESG